MSESREQVAAAVKALKAYASLLQSYETRCFANDHDYERGSQVEQIADGLARALAACALEARLEETKRLRKVVAAAQSVDEFYVFFDTTIPTSANGARIAIQILRDELRALERAAGEKS